MNPDLRFAHELADMADVISLSRWRSLDLKVERKLDLTEVTEADRQIEERIRDRLSRDRPGERVVGEEYGGDLADTSGARWVVDPIYGTRSFIRGYETWASADRPPARRDHGLRGGLGARTRPALRRRPR